MKEFVKAVRAELKKVRKVHPPIHSLHEGYAIILEELDEVKEEVWKRPGNRSKARLLAELVQVAAMCQRMVEDVVLGD